MHGEDIAYAYGFWSLAAVNAALFLFFILSFMTPLKKREWRSMGVTIAFFVALFTEMYGFPLTIYMLTGFLGSTYPALNPFSHASGHLWVVFLGGGATMLAIVHLISNVIVLAGFWIMWKGWRLVHKSKGGFVTAGLYAHVRHPQYSGLFLVMVGMLIQWPTLITAVMFPVLAYVYYRLSKREEKDMLIIFGGEYTKYMEKIPMFVPEIGAKRASMIHNSNNSLS